MLFTLLPVSLRDFCDRCDFAFSAIFSCCHIQGVNFNREIKHDTCTTSRELQDPARKNIGDALTQSTERGIKCAETFSKELSPFHDFCEPSNF